MYIWKFGAMALRAHRSSSETGTTEPLSDSSPGRPGRPRRRAARWAGVTAALALVSGVGGAALAGATPASASTVPFSEDSGLGPATGTVYNLTVPGSWNAGNVLMVSDTNGNSQPLTLQPVVEGGAVTAASSEFQFTPSAAAGNAGGTLHTGFGQLASRWTGECLTAVGSGNSATLGEAACASDSIRDGVQLWTLTTWQGATYLRNKAAGENVGFNSPGCVAAAGVPLNLHSADNCGALQANVDSYTFLTKTLTFGFPTSDPNSYSCVPGYTFATSGGYAGLPLVYQFTSGESAGAELPDPAPVTNPQTIASGTITYSGAGAGQARLECDPTPALAGS
jgi:hypothetical protein